MLAILFHVAGLIGILLSPYKTFFIEATPVTLVTMASLLILTQKEKNPAFIVFFFLTIITGIGAEMIGTNTGTIFGNYSYTNILGPAINGVPLIIGINWFIVIYCCGVVTYIFEQWIMKKFLGEGVDMSGSMQTLSFVIDASLLTVFFDWILEPAAEKLGLWQWENEEIPLYNYLCWFIISMGLMFCFRRLKFNKHNIFALHLLIIQLLFFLSIETFLK